MRLIDLDNAVYLHDDAEYITYNVKLDARIFKTKQIKYYDDEEQVWKIGEVIVNSSEKPNNLSEIPTSSERSSE